MRRGSRTCIVYLVAGMLAAGAVGAPASAARPAAQEYVFPTGAGVLFFHVRADRTTDFEAIVTRIGEALDRSADPVRRQQAAHWRIYKSAEAARETVIYLFFFDPVVSGADYDPIKVLSEDSPAELSALFERLKANIVRVERMGLTKLR
jgi:hypothetical protein